MIDRGDSLESAAEHNDIRQERIKACVWCGGPMPARMRSDAKYCSEPCKRKNFTAHCHDGRIASVRRLKSGKMSVIVHMDHDVGYRPGTVITIGEVENE